jgi:CheY-like chemotaxis protein
LARKILLADDSVTAQNMGRKILADAGYEVITVNNGSAALKKIAETKPDIIILDVYMPGYSGLEVCQRLKEAQETARVPVLLTVGKLEPFKPEEARRVRAEGYIVKPFEASELLSALSKLEDKIVPRPEPSKPGRFARANAAIDESRYDKTVAIDEDSGWKNRIGFPSKSKKAPEDENDDSTIYNAVNKDLRTVVDRKLAQESQEAKAAAAKSEDARVDLGALAPEGLPKDVTPEEIAALAAAAAQVKGKLADSPLPASTPDMAGTSSLAASEKSIQEATAVELKPADAQVTEAAKKEFQSAQEPPNGSTVATATFATQKSEEHSEGSAENPAQQHLSPQHLSGVADPSPSEMMAAIAGLIPEVGKAADASGNGAGSHEGSSQGAPQDGSREGVSHSFASNLQPASIPSSSIDEAPSGASKLEVTKDVAKDIEVVDPRNFRRRASDHPAGEPVTMAAAAGVTLGGSTSRWTAVAVALAAGEATLSLENEMQKAHAAFAAADVAHERFAAGRPEAVPEIQPEAAPTAAAAESALAQPVSGPPVLAGPVLAESVTADSGLAEPASGEPAPPVQTSSLSGSESGSASEAEARVSSETGTPAGQGASAGTASEESSTPAAASDAIATAVKEFDKVGPPNVASNFPPNFASQPDASAVQEAAAVQSPETVVQSAAEIQPSDIGPSTETKSQDTVEAVSPPHHTEPEATTVDVAKEAAKEDTPDPAPQEPKYEGQIKEEVTAEVRQAETEVRQPEAREQFVPADLKSAEPVGEAAAVVSAAEESGAGAKSGDTPDSNSREPVNETVINQAAEPAFTRAGFSEATTPAISSQPAVGGGIKGMAKKESEISETTAAAWANWRRIRESGENKSATAQPATPKPLIPEAVPVNSAEEKNPSQPEAAMAVAAGAESSPEASPEESSAAPEDSGEIASIVDSVLAQMRPRIVEEISRKLGKKK